MPAEPHLLSPLGFRAAGVYAGIKSKQVSDVGLLVCDTRASAAGVFTTNKVVAAPVKLGRAHVAGGRLRGVVVNSGNANACTGRRGERDALRMCRLAAEVFGCNAAEVLPSSTGIIGHHLPMEKLERGIAAAGQALGGSAEHALLFADAILTTDLKRKSAAVRFNLGRKTVTLAGVCKGSGMIGPRMAIVGRRQGSGVRGQGLGVRSQERGRRYDPQSAIRNPHSPHATMLAYLTTDASISPALLRRLMAGACDGSFNAVTVDDHTSTNDTALLLASGVSGAKVSDARAVRSFAAALDEVCRSLAYQIAADGEGATKVVVVTVRGARSTADAQAMARAIANSPLVKCAMHGNDPNWGRIVSAAGMCGAAFDPDRATLTLQGAVVFRRGGPVPFRAQQVSQSLAAPEVRVELSCGLGKFDATVYTCDLSKEYVTINADYHT